MGLQEMERKNSLRCPLSDLVGPPPLPLKKLTLTCVGYSHHQGLLALLPWLPQLHTLDLDGLGIPNTLLVALGIHFR